jgi:hypothetical protein
MTDFLVVYVLGCILGCLTGSLFVWRFGHFREFWWDASRLVRRAMRRLRRQPEPEPIIPEVWARALLDRQLDSVFNSPFRRLVDERVKWGEGDTFTIPKIENLKKVNDGKETVQEGQEGKIGVPQGQGRWGAMWDDGNA